MAKLRLNDEKELFYLDSGAMNGQPIVFLHGFSSEHAEFTGQINAFIAEGYRTIQVDLRNHGRSSFDVSANIARLSTDIAELIAHLALENVIFVAHSMGAAVVWSYCQLFGTADIARIVTIDESPQLIKSENWPYSLFDFSWAHILEMADRFKNTKMTVSRLPDETFTAMKAEQAAYPFDIDKNVDLLTNHVSLKWQHVIENIDVKQLFVAGSNSPLWSSDHAKYLANYARLGQWVVIPKTGHLPHAENPEVFNREVLNFLQKNE